MTRNAPRILALLLLLLLGAGLAQARPKVLLDVDIDDLNDDAVALFMLLAAEAEVLGVTTVTGNTWVEEGTATALRQLELVGRADVPIVAGAGEPSGGSLQRELRRDAARWGELGYVGAYARRRPASHRRLGWGRAPYGGYPRTEPAAGTAVDFLARTIRAHPGEVTLLVLGPATNVAALVREHPDAPPLVARVIWMGGAFDVPGTASAAAEFNWWFDPAAARAALAAPFPEQVVVPLDVAHTVRYTGAEYARIAAGPDTPLVEMFRDLHGPAFDRDPDHATFVWDALTAAILLDPAIAVGYEEARIEVDATPGPGYGRSTRTGGAGAQRILAGVDAAAFWDLYVELVTRPVPLGR